MINFIVVDDVVEIAKTIEKIINSRLMNSDLEYKIHVFHDYDSAFVNASNTLTNKVYFLDIETKSASGIDVARTIRKNDVSSVIVFVTAHEQLAGSIIKERLMALTFICKFDDFENKFKDAVDKSVEILGHSQVIKFYDNNSLYIIPIKDILYVTRDSVERKCIIKTDYITYKVSMSLKEIKDMSKGLLIQTHRSCLINKQRIRKIDKTNKILLDNNEETNLLSSSHRKELM